MLLVSRALAWLEHHCQRDTRESRETHSFAIYVNVTLPLSPRR